MSRIGPQVGEPPSGWMEVYHREGATVQAPSWTSGRERQLRHRPQKMGSTFFGLRSYSDNRPIGQFGVSKRIPTSVLKLHLEDGSESRHRSWERTQKENDASTPATDPRPRNIFKNAKSRCSVCSRVCAGLAASKNGGRNLNLASVTYVRRINIIQSYYFFIFYRLLSSS